VYDKFITVCTWFVLFQSLVGMLQFVATRNPDAVCGTFGLLDGFRQNITIAQVYFTFTIFGMILFLVPAASGGLPKAAIAAGSLTCVLAQSGHQLIFFVVALVLCGMARVTHLGTLVRAVAAAAVMIFLVLQFYPDSVWLAREWYEKAIDASQSPKLLALEGAASIMEEPKNVIIGTGLGQYCSRAALISSNEYLNIHLPGFLSGQSGYFNEYIHPSLVLFEEIGEGSAIAKPYMSAISLPVELGLVLSIILLAVIGRGVFWCARLMTTSGGQTGWIGFTMMVGIVFFLLCCFIENYAEFSQAILVPFLLFVVAGSRAQTLLRTAACKQSQTVTRVSGLPQTSYSLAIRPR
jgi:hypothetical protein